MTRLNFTVCPFCGAEHEVASAVIDKRIVVTDEPSMRPGHLAICIECGEVSVMGDSEMLRKPTRPEARELKRDAQVSKLREAWQATRKRKLGTLT